MKELSDAELMARTSEGDRPAFGVLVNRYKDPIVNYLTKITGNRSNAEEAAQETFVKLFHAAPRYREQGQFSAYLYRIATNLVRQEERRRRRWHLVSGVLARSARAVTEDRESAHQALLRQELGRELVAALARLPIRYRVPLVLRDVQGWSYEDIARLTASRLGTVKSRISRGRSLLRHSLEPYRNRGETLAQRTTA
ncbi:MAG: sigma-70 family RNA polymerase sigma factor [Acidobacteria bacterium]|nr:sigma-70 family RNA polymerase sigma factor [Acidobacteriota bacterium]MCZ6745988.1 sigma-70 family RNA polymerase sigma factor [Acidobacteriota bacterium]MCZ6833864.1 sigma-70 family RNA polymerase sigma factor [Acidobacteriota bacterium]